MQRNLSALLITLLLLPAIAAAADSKIIMDFETEDELKLWEVIKYDEKTETDEIGKLSTKLLSEEHVTHGAKSLKLAPNSYIRWEKNPDWSAYDVLEIDVFVEGDDLVTLTTVVADKDWANHPQQPRVFNNRHNDTRTLMPGANTVSISVHGLFRGELGSRNKDLKYNIKPNEIIRFDLGFATKSEKVSAIYLDNFRLVKETVPAGIIALDFGPGSQPIYPGFQPVAWNTVYGKDGAKVGLKRPQPSANTAQSDTFPTRLYGDYVELNDAELIVDVPDGDYAVWAVFNDTAEWSWFNSRHRKRWVNNNGKPVLEQDRGEGGPTDYLFRFEKIEPKPGDDMWDLYMQYLFVPVRFEAKATGGKLNLDFHADAQWSTKLTSLVIYPKDKTQEAEAWLKDIEQRNRQEFTKRAVMLGPKPTPLQVPEQAAAQGWWLGYPSLDQDVRFTDAPGPFDGGEQRTAAPGNAVSYTFAIRPLKDFGDAEVQLTTTGLKGPGGEIAPTAMELRYVHHNAHRGFQQIAYEIGPDTLRPVQGSGLKLTPNLTRQFWIVVNLPADAKGGLYRGEMNLTAGALKVNVPLAVNVLPFTPTVPDFKVGFFGFSVPGDVREARWEKAQRQLFAMMKQAGMTTYTGGPNMKFQGYENGKPKIDFAACDAFFKLAKECGYGKLAFAYGGPGGLEGLHDGASIGANGRRWEKEIGKPFKEILREVWQAVAEHEKANDWPVIYRGFIDEPRVLQQALDQVELMKLYREVAPQVKNGGYYGVHWEKSDPLNLAIQELFKTMVWSSVNVHSQIDFDKAKEYGIELQVYNQGRDRFSFGAYQWAEQHKGVKARIQWHGLALHGYQFFHIDGREPDSAMFNFGREQIYPTINFYRSREGSYDFALACMLETLAHEKKDSAEGQAALAWLDEVNAKIKAGERRPPEGFMEDEAFRSTCIEHLQKLGAGK